MTTTTTIAAEHGRDCDLKQLFRHARLRSFDVGHIVTMRDGAIIKLNGRRHKLIVKLNVADLYDVELGHTCDFTWRIDQQRRDIPAEVLADTIHEVLHA